MVVTGSAFVRSIFDRIHHASAAMHPAAWWITSNPSAPLLIVALILRTS
jgi:hypothetical protein